MRMKCLAFVVSFSLCGTSPCYNRLSCNLRVNARFHFYPGTVLGPVIFGSIFDGTCIVWQEKCGENGSCWIYDNDLLSRNLLLISIAMKAGSTLWFFLAQALYKKPPADKLGTTATTTTTPSGQDSQLPKVAVISNGSRDQAGFEGYMECVDRGSGRTNPAFTM